MNTVIGRTHNGYNVTVNNAMHFEVDFEGESRTYHTYAEATAAIDAHIARLNTVPKEKLALAAINDAGIPVTITGVHAATGKVLRTPKQAERFHSETLYPDTPAVRALVSASLEAQRRYQAISNQLATVAMSQNYRALSGAPVDMPRAYTALRAEYARKSALALALGEGKPL